MKTSGEERVYAYPDNDKDGDDGDNDDDDDVIVMMVTTPMMMILAVVVVFVAIVVVMEVIRVSATGDGKGVRQGGVQICSL